MSYIACLRNYSDKREINLSVWSTEKIEPYRLTFYDEDQGKYEILNIFRSDHKLSYHFKLNQRLSKDNVVVKIYYDRKQIITCKANKNADKIFAVSCDYPDIKTQTIVTLLVLLYLVLKENLRLLFREPLVVRLIKY